MAPQQPARSTRAYFDDSIEVFEHLTSMPSADVSFSGGPERIETDRREAEPVRRVGFTAPLPRREPLVWEGDQA